MGALGCSRIIQQEETKHQGQTDCSTPQNKCDKAGRCTKLLFSSKKRKVHAEEDWPHAVRLDSERGGVGEAIQGASKVTGIKKAKQSALWQGKIDQT